MAWYNPLTWGEKASDNILDKDTGLAVKFGGFVNDLHYSDAEKAENNLTVTQFALDRLKLFHPKLTDYTKPYYTSFSVSKLNNQGRTSKHGHSFINSSLVILPSPFKSLLKSL